VIFNAGDAWQDRFAAFGVPVFVIPRHPVKLWRLLKLSALSSRERAGVLHSWSWHTNVYVALAFPVPRARRVLSFRNNPMVDNQTGQRRRNIPNEYVYRRADCVVSNSHTALDNARGIAIRRRELVGNITVARGRADPGATPSKLTVVAAGALKPAKGFDVLLSAIDMIRRADDLSFELLIAGSGSDDDSLRRLASELRLTDCVTFLGEVDDVPALLSRAHILVHPSRNEGLSNTVLEGMAEGLPVIASSVGGTPEVIEHDVTGILVPPDDPAALAGQIRRLVEDPSLRARLGTAGLQVVRDRFGADTVVRQYEAIYTSLLAG
jgi:glycosyltransferase involved in cell wall biosynthesis